MLSFRGVWVITSIMYCHYHQYDYHLYYLAGLEAEAGVVVRTGHEVKVGPGPAVAILRGVTVWEL